MADWTDAYDKTWLPWPQFDTSDHERCGPLDQNNSDVFTPYNSSHLPYHKKATSVQTEKMFVNPWEYQKNKTSEAYDFEIRVWQRK
jgi:hypothetical protein